jgi:uroporphyrin-III C-methyltransferase/precorrin-2 dehydrogenase/sirohydrochlorin ferrochelatase
MPRRFLPLAVDLRRRPCVVVGGGAVGTRKVATLLEGGARVTVVAPEVSPELRKEVGAGRVRWTRSAFRPAHLDGAFLAVAATDDWVVNAAVVRAADRRGVLACDASSGTRSRIIFGALLERPDVTVAVFTGGRDPARARDTRDAIARVLEAPEDES